MNLPRSVRPALAALTAALALVSIALAVVPVTTRPGDLLPDSVAAVVPFGLASTEVSCGSVVDPFDPNSVSGFTGAVSKLIRSDCTSQVRDRLWWAIGILALAIAGTAATLQLPRTSNNPTRRTRKGDRP